MDTKVEGENAKLEVVEYRQFQAGFWIRFWAYLVDLLAVGSLNRILVYPIFDLLGFDATWFIFTPEAIVATFLYFVYFLIMTKYFKQTLGKMIFGLKVTSLNDSNHLPWGSIIFRELVGRYISKTILIGYIIVAFTPKKQGLHDIFADTQVIHERLYIKKARVEMKKEPAV